MEDSTEVAHEVEVVKAIQTPDLETGPAPTPHAEITTSHGETTATSAIQKNQKAPAVTGAAMAEAGAVEVADLGVVEGVGVIEEAVALVEIVEGVETDSEAVVIDLEGIVGVIEEEIVVEVVVVAAMVVVALCVEVVGVEAGVIVTDPIKFLFPPEETSSHFVL